MPRLIGLHGKARAGKDTVANILFQNHGFVAIALAKPIKDACRLLFGWSEYQLYGYAKDQVDPTTGLIPRREFQRIGDWIKSQYGQDYFVKRAVTEFQSHQLDSVITDVRYDYEAEAILHNGGELFHIVRPGQMLIDSHDHTSEQGIRSDLLLKCSIIDNSKDIEFLVNQIHNLLS